MIKVDKTEVICDKLIKLITYIFLIIGSYFYLESIFITIFLFFCMIIDIYKIFNLLIMEEEE